MKQLFERYIEVCMFDGAYEEGGYRAGQGMFWVVRARLFGGECVCVRRGGMGRGKMGAWVCVREQGGISSRSRSSRSRSSRSKSSSTSGGKMED